MNLMLDLAEDFSTAVDGVIPVVLHRRGGAEIAIPNALKAPREAVVQLGIGFASAEWWFCLPEGVDRVSEGDRLIEANGDCWRVVRARPTRNHGPVRCDAFLERFEEVLTDLVDIDEEGESGERKIVRAAVAARVQFVEALTDESSNPPASISRYRFYIERGLRLDGHHRLLLATGEMFKVDAFRPAGAERPLSEVDATQLQPSQG